MSRARLECEFWQGQKGALYCQRYHPHDMTGPVGSVVMLPAFGEESNKSRHLVSGLARHLAGMGYLVHLQDFYGTGDSEGELQDADTEIWVQDLVDYLAGQDHAGPRVLMGFRLGASLAAHWLAKRLVEPSRMVLIEPVGSGRRYLDQFLKLKLAGAFGPDAGTVADLRGQLLANGALEVSGYTLTPPLIAGIDATELGNDCPPPGVQVDMCQLSSAEGPPAARLKKVAEQWQAAGAQCRALRVRGEAFWRQQELVPVADTIADIGRLLE